VPGIAIDRDQGEGRYVVIRGIDSNLTSFSVDGVGLASPKSDERAVLMDIIPSGVMDALEIYKVTTPDQPGDGIGGYVNVRTPSAFEENTLVARMSVQGNYSDLSASGASASRPLRRCLRQGCRIGFMATVS
jgi:outer membrane receptor protein involved in Fe transport